VDRIALLTWKLEKSDLEVVVKVGEMMRVVKNLEFENKMASNKRTSCCCQMQFTTVIK